MPPQLIHMGVNFLLQQNLGPSRKVGELSGVVQTCFCTRCVARTFVVVIESAIFSSTQAYVHCKAGRGRSGAVVMAYIVARDMRLHEAEQRVLVTQQLSPVHGSPGGASSAAAAAALSSKLSLASRSLALEVCCLHSMFKLLRACTEGCHAREHV